MNKKSNNLNIPKKVTTFGMILLVIIGTIIATDIRATGNNGWEVTLDIAEIGGTGDYVVFGEKSDALDNKDSYDVPKPPPPLQPPYIRAWFDDKLTDPYNILLKDYRKYPDNYKEWNLSVQWIPSDYTSPTNVTISWNISEVILSEYSSVILYDCDKNVSREMTNSSAYEYSSEAMKPRYFQIIASGTENNPPGDSGDQNGQVPSDQNVPPIADADGPYIGAIGIPVTFDGSDSSDPDGEITNYTWHFGDGTEGYGKITDHIYAESGNYTIALAVVDDGGKKSSNLTYAIITSVANNPPSMPVVNGPTTGQKDIIYNYTAVSTDPDNDTVRYFFDWGDGVNMTSDFLASGTIYNTSRNWTNSGVYTVRVYAEDENNGVSGTSEMTVFIDVNVLFIDDVIQGYLLDWDNDGTYDIFHNNATGNETGVELQDDGNYLIDSDGDTIWNYEYDPWTSMLIQQSGEGEYSEEKTDTPWYLIGIVVILLMLIFIIIYRVEKLKENQKLKKNEMRKEKIWR